MPEITSSKATLLTALNIGAIWGIIESTAGYCLHLIPISLGFIVWYPIAYYFLIKAYRDSGTLHAIPLTAAFAAAIKLIDLLLPGRIDKVINPAISIVLEGLAVYAVVRIILHIKTRIPVNKNLSVILAFSANSLWRIMFIIYLALLAPPWIKDVSVLSSTDLLLRFLVVDNIVSSLVAGLGVIAASRFFKNSYKHLTAKDKPQLAGVLIIIVLLAADIGLQILL